MRFLAEDAEIVAEIEALIVAGWTGRDPVSVQHHIDELSAIGVPPPSTVPLFYRVARTLLVQCDSIEVLGPSTSGEAEPFLLNLDGVLWLGLGSDHTDRALETVSVAASKQACAKPVSRSIWRFDDLAGHLDALILQCEIEEEGTWRSYQQGPLAAILPLHDLADRAGLAPGQAMLCGTLGAIGGVRPASAYRMRLTDPQRKRDLRLEYRVEALPVVS